jgi:hypothetical protein
VTEGGRQRRDAAAMLRRAIVRTGRQGEEGKAAGEDPHHNVKLLGRWLDGGERRSGGPASSRSTEATMEMAEELGCLGFRRRRRLRLGEELGHGEALK